MIYSCGWLCKFYLVKQRHAGGKIHSYTDPDLFVQPKAETGNSQQCLRITSMDKKKEYFTVYDFPSGNEQHARIMPHCKYLIYEHEQSFSLFPHWSVFIIVIIIVHESHAPSRSANTYSERGFKLKTRISNPIRKTGHVNQQLDLWDWLIWTLFFLLRFRSCEAI